MHLPVTALRTRPPLPPRTAVGARPERSEPWGRHGNATPGRCAPCRPCGGARPVAVLPAAPQPAYLTRAELGVLQQRGTILSFLGLHLVPAARSAQRAQRQLAGRHRREAQTRLAAPQPTGTAPPCRAALCPAGAGQRPPQPGGHVMGADGRKRPQPQLGAAPGPSAAAIFGEGSARRGGGQEEEAEWGFGADLWCHLSFWGKSYSYLRQMRTSRSSPWCLLEYHQSHATGWGHGGSLPPVS